MYCRTCGKENPDSATECATCGTNPAEGNMYCPKCGHFCQPGDIQCVNCGFSLADSPSLTKTIATENSISAAPVPPIQEPVTPVSEPQYTHVDVQTSGSVDPQNESTKKYCRNCGLIIDAVSLRCPFCDALVNTGTQYCPKCGMTTTPQDATCAYCGEKFDKAPSLDGPAQQQHSQPQTNTNQQYKQPSSGTNVPPYINYAPPAQQRNTYGTNYNRPDVASQEKGSSFLVTLLLCIFLGFLGIHRFYTKNWVIGILQLCTFGICCLWWLVDIILIAVGSYRDGDGRPLDKDI